MPIPTLTEEFESLKSRVSFAGAKVCRSDSQSSYHLLIITQQLREAGHAVVFDETFNPTGEFVESHLIHYLNCNKCRETGKGKEN